MMISLNELAKPLMWYVGTCVVGTIVVLLFLYNPKYMIYLYNRYLLLKLGLQNKKITVSPNFHISYIERGSHYTSTSILLLHGYSGAKENWLGTIKYLPRTRHIIAVDLFGHGQTSVDEKKEYSIATYVSCLKEFVKHVGLSRRKFHLVGISLGGHIAGMYSAAHPEDLISLTMICPHGISSDKEVLMRKETERTQTSIFLPQTEADMLQLLRQTQCKEINLPGWVLSGILHMRKEREAFNIKALKSLYDDHSIHQLEKNLHKINTPLLIIWGKEDKIVDIECLDTIREKLVTPPRKVVILENVGHVVYFERPRKCACVLLEFFNTFE